MHLEDGNLNKIVFALFIATGPVLATVSVRVARMMEIC